VRWQFTGLRFAEMPIHADTKRAVAEVLGYEHATKVQTESLPPCLAGSDVLAKAKTGTGKTLAFLVPVIEKLASVPLNQRRGEISALIISPTRELAMQIEKELKQLCTFHDQTGLVRNTLVAVGGQKVGKNVAALRQTDRLPDIVVATPGRLFDLLENYGLAKQMTKLKILVFDEADMLFEMGFMNDIRKIMAKLPPKATRQTISFSATMPRDVETLAKTVMRADNFEFVDTVGEEDNTHAHIAQQFTVCPFGEEATVLLHNLQAEMDSNPNFKGVVFFNTAALTKYYAQLFNKIGLDVLEMHSRKSQSAREKVSAEFKKRSRCFLFTSDVSARGMDYPDVSGVFQVGAPAETAKYVHRLGRTGRAGVLLPRAPITHTHTHTHTHAHSLFLSLSLSLYRSMLHHRSLFLALDAQCRMPHRGTLAKYRAVIARSRWARNAYSRGT
jgi:ATP-dependent RNA helicase MSS116